MDENNLNRARIEAFKLLLQWADEEERNELECEETEAENRTNVLHVIV